MFVGGWERRVGEAVGRQEGSRGGWQGGRQRQHRGWKLERRRNQKYLWPGLLKSCLSLFTGTNSRPRLSCNSKRGL